MMVKVQSAAEFQNGIYYEYDTDSRPLGQGGMGVVYQGFCFHEGDRSQFIPVAIKQMTYTTPALIDKAMREASIQVDNDHLLRMFGFVPNWEQDLSTGVRALRYYVVMEALWGVNLDSLISGHLTDQYGNRCEYADSLYELYNTNRVEFVKTVMASVLSGVKALHDSGVIHRDIDPSNVMITQDGKIKVIDFGISKKIDGSVSRTGGTVIGSLMGKVDYAPPEMITGDVEHHGYTTDIYELGIMMYQLAVGNLPFSGDNAHIAQCQIQTPVPVDNVPDKALRKIIRKATQKAQPERYQSIDEMISDLERLSPGDSRETGDDEAPRPQAREAGRKAEISEPKEPVYIPKYVWYICAGVGFVVGIALRLILSN